MILLITLLYSNYLADNLALNEKQIHERYVNALRTVSESSNLGDDMVTEFTIIKDYSLPVIVFDENIQEYSGNNWGGSKDTTQTFLAKKFKGAVANGRVPSQGAGPAEGQFILVFERPLNDHIRLFPIVQLLLLGLFGVMGYFLIDEARKSEQNRVWAGMAKETAHQLGTPISAMLAWLDILRESNDERPDQIEIVDELGKDVERLELIADRFSKIGSDPELESTDLYEQLDGIESYMKRRASRKVEFDFPKDKEPLYINVNRHLFSWVLENLIRNALDAMDGQGKISCNVNVDEGWVKVYLSDTGKGIPSGSHKDVFKPGFSTKKRGWGLGLSLAKRIIKEYHKGKIFVKQSKVNEGTTFAIFIPKA